MSKEPLIFVGAIEDLQQALAAAGCSGDWSPIEHGFQFRSRDGATMNWYPQRGKCSFGGSQTLKSNLEAKVRAVIEDGEVVSGERSGRKPMPVPDAPLLKVFVVHGHDDASREQLELILHRLGLDPFVLMNTGGDGLTIIEALEQEIGTHEGAARFGIVLMTPDDVGYSKAAGSDTAEPRARQNVVLEMGMLIQAIGKRNVAILKKGHLEVPSDANGIIYLSYNEHVKEVVNKLVDRLRSSGVNIDPARITAAGS